MKTHKIKGKQLRYIAIGFLIILVLAAAFYVTALSRLQLVTDSYGNQFFMGDDALAINTDGSNSIKMFVFASAPYPKVLFTAYNYDGSILAQGYGTGHNNVVELDVPIYGANYPRAQTPPEPLNPSIVGEFTLTGTAQVENNPPIQNSMTLLIIDQNVQPMATNSPATQTVTPMAMLTVNVHDAPTGNSFNLVSIFDSNNQRVGLTQTTKSDDGTYYYSRISVADAQTYTVQIECAGYITQAQTVTVNGDTTIELTPQPVTPLNQNTGAAIQQGQMPTGQLNTQADQQQIVAPTFQPKPWYQFILDFFSFKWLPH